MTERMETTRVRVEVLGPLQLMVDGSAVELPGSKRRAVLVVLALAEGRTLSVGQLVGAVWPEDQAIKDRQALQSHVYRLRRHLGGAASCLETMPGGYRLGSGVELDLAEARSLLERAERVKVRDADAALALLREAHALWRGPVLADLMDLPELALAATAIERLRHDVVDALVSCAVAMGRGDEVIEIAISSVADGPLRESGVLGLMRVLAATGSVAEALRAAHDFRLRLAEETGLAPTAAVAELEHRIAAGVLELSGRPAPVVRRGPTTPLTGRESEVAEIDRLLDTEPLVTMVGPGGVGKTRLTLEIVLGRDNAFVLPLSPVTDGAVIPHALASALNLSVTSGDVLSACVGLLADRPCTILIDNCEHLLDATREIVHLLVSACPELRVLATSREPLGLTAERVIRLGPLPVPALGADPASAPSVALFLQRAAKVCAGRPFSDNDLLIIAEIARRLDGMPLAIELAAGRLSTLSLGDLHARLDRSLDLLSGPMPSSEWRHRSLRATMDWSYQLLADEEQQLFRHLSTFPDGVDLDLAERVAQDLGLEVDPVALLARLVDASMIRLEHDDHPRYRMLETMRLFANDRLGASGEGAAAEDRLLDWAVDVSAWIGQTLRTANEPQADAVLRRELPNLRAAWTLARRRGANVTASAMIVPLYDAVAYRDLVELRHWAVELADDPLTTEHPVAGAVLGVAGEAAYHDGDLDRAEQLCRKGLSLADEARDVASCVLPLAKVALAQGDHDAVAEHAQAVSQSGPRWAEITGVAALAAAYAGDTDTARTLNRGAYAGESAPTMQAWQHYIDAEIENRLGRLDRAEHQYLGAIALARSSGATFLVGVATVGLLTARGALGEVTDTLRGYVEVIDYFAGTGNWTHLWVTLRNLAALLRVAGDAEAADTLESSAKMALGSASDHLDGWEVAAPASTSVLGREQVVRYARSAIDRGTRR